VWTGCTRSSFGVLVLVHTSDAFQCINKAMLGASLVVVQREPLVFGAKPPKSTPSLLYLPFVFQMKRIRAH